MTFDPYALMSLLGAVVVCAPLSLTLFLGSSSLLLGRLAERTINRAILASVSCGLLSALTVLALMLFMDTRHVVLDAGEWAVTPRFHVLVKFVFDRLSVPFAILSFILTGVVSAFSTRYMHRERGYNRFFFLFALFLLGVITASLAGTIETLFIGWEFVGLSSTLLVSFFQERPAPSRNGLWIWSVYRTSDAALLLGAFVLHHLSGEGDFDQLLGGESWPDGQTSLSSFQAGIVGSLILVAAAGKSGLAPFSGWLPRAMEGPTPSSAIFYGALSVHLGAFLLLRVSPLLDCSPALSGAVVALGLTTTGVAYLAGRAQTDIKSALSYACLSQVGLITAEIGLGFRYLALVHLLGHACLRTLQFLRAPTLLRDYHSLENAIGERLPPPSLPAVPIRIGSREAQDVARGRLYRFALERAHLDDWLIAAIVGPFLRFFRWCDARERAWTGWLAGASSRKKGEEMTVASGMEELL